MKSLKTEKSIAQRVTQLRPFMQGKRIACQDHRREAGLGTLEVVVITGILLTVALIFNQEIRGFATQLFNKVFNEGRVLNSIM